MRSLSTSTGFASQVKKAEAVLEANWNGRFTETGAAMPGRQLSWDAGFMAMGLSPRHLKRAMLEMRTLFESQWANGMLPHMIFKPEASQAFFPGPDYWQAPGELSTSGISSPPIQATACLSMLRQAGARDQVDGFLRGMWPRLVSGLNYFYSQRDPDHEGLAYIRHPWESGLDYCPAWERVLSGITSDEAARTRRQIEQAAPDALLNARPDGDYLARCMWLVDLFRSLEYDEAAMARECPFMVQDPLFNSVLVRSAKDLTEIGRHINQDVAQVEEWALAGENAIRDALWSAQSGGFCPREKRSGEFMPPHGPGMFMPLWAEAASREQADILHERLQALGYCALNQGNCFTVPDYDHQAGKKDHPGYWKGPVSPHLNWLLSKGLAAYGYRARAEGLCRDLIQLAVRYGFQPAYDEPAGQGAAEARSSRTAAVFLELVEQYQRQDEYGGMRLPWKQYPQLSQSYRLNPASADPQHTRPGLPNRLAASLARILNGYYQARRGIMDYQGLKDSEPYREYQALTAGLAHFDPQILQTREQKLGFWLNLYNALVIQGVVELDLEHSVRQAGGFFSRLLCRVGGLDYSLDQIGHGILRGNARPPYRFKRVFGDDDSRLQYRVKGLVDPRIHFALCGGARSGPLLRVYDPDYIDQQLESACQHFANSAEVVIRPAENEVLLSRIFHWHSGDFGGKRSALRFLIPYIIDADKRRFLKDNLGRVRIEYLYFDWSLNQ